MIFLWLQQQIAKGLNMEDSTNTAKDIESIGPSMQTILPTLFNASSVFLLSFAPKQRTILSWHLLPVSLLFPPHHHMVMRVAGGRECIHSAGSTTHAVCDHQGGYCTADFVTCHSTMEVQIPVLTENSRAQWAPNIIRSMWGLRIKSLIELLYRVQWPVMVNE